MLIFYFFAVVGMELFAEELSGSASFPSRFQNFDDFDK